MVEDNYKYIVCKKCLSKIPILKVIIKETKAICPYCNRTLETSKIKVNKIKNKQGM